MLQSFQSLNHLIHTTLLQPFRITCERYIFLKKGCSFIIIVDYVSACICICICYTCVLCFQFFGFFKTEEISNKWHLLITLIAVYFSNENRAILASFILKKKIYFKKWYLTYSCLISISLENCPWTNPT